MRSIALIGCGTYDQETRSIYRKRFAEALSEKQKNHMNRLRARIAYAKSPFTAAMDFEELGTIATRALRSDPLPRADAAR